MYLDQDVLLWGAEDLAGIDLASFTFAGDAESALVAASAVGRPWTMRQE